MHVQFDSVKRHLIALGDNYNNDVLGFDSRLLFMSADIILPILLKFFYVSIENKIVIPDWKLSKVTPIYKGKGNQEEADNYRLISLIGHIIMKILEKEVKVEVMDYLETNHLITVDQSAYVKQHCSSQSGR